MDVQAVDDDIHAVMASPWLLRFPPRWEARYDRDTGGRRTRAALAVGWFALLLNDVFVYGDYTIDRSLLWRAVLARLLVFTPVTLACLWATRRHQATAVRELSKLLVIGTAGGGAVWIVTAYSGPAAVVGQLGMMLIMFFGAVVYRIGFPYAVATNAILLLEEVAFLHRDRLLDDGVGMTCLFLMMAACGVSLLANYRLERSDRHAWRLLLQAELQAASLARLNNALEEVSTRDGLTGLANRRRFDACIEAASAEAAATGRPLSVVMADIDHFKRLNDTHGHLVGDSVLVTVAATIAACARRQGDTAARYGGEEFVMVLPGTDARDALALAERVVKNVRRQQLDLADGETPVRVTVSCGVASSGPGGDLTPTALIARADRALYAAKHQGRDRVVVCDDAAVDAPPTIDTTHAAPTPLHTTTARPTATGSW